ncbi:thiamine pyrophosphate-binding protein, partial [Leucobacter sp. M11]|uniref:thiamine pyrophosphate-binding protein n=1 Tax=Leucobacter sp. M11 TaxID=2993565 RepID=UPI002D7E4860
MTQRPDTCAERLARALARHSRIAFGVMGNGNAHVIDALLRTECRYLATRHEAGAVGAADGFWRATGSLAVATVTYGPGYTNALTPLAEAAQARTPMLVVIGAAPSTGPRPWDVDQPALAEALGVPTVTLSADGIEATVAEASRRSLSERRPVVIALPYDVATSPANGPSSAEGPATPTAREVT